MPATAWTWSLSASFLSLVKAAAGSPWVSSIITSTFRPTIWLLISSRLIMKPFDMSLPTAAPPPVICVRKPNLIGPFCGHAGTTSTVRANTSTPQIAAIRLVLIPILLRSLLLSGRGLQPLLASLLSSVVSLRRGFPQAHKQSSRYTRRQESAASDAYRRKRDF